MITGAAGSGSGSVALSCAGGGETTSENDGCAGSMSAGSAVAGKKLSCALTVSARSDTEPISPSMSAVLGRLKSSSFLNITLPALENDPLD